MELDLKGLLALFVVSLIGISILGVFQTQVYDKTRDQGINETLTAVINGTARSLSASPLTTVGTATCTSGVGCSLIVTNGTVYMNSTLERTSYTIVGSTFTLTNTTGGAAGPYNNSNLRFAYNYAPAGQINESSETITNIFPVMLAIVIVVAVVISMGFM